ncbi:MAG: hypothetical protein POELPBGB_03241 [Bacteroidia bacterium]|nr:hypothetical protein [Bacteroidia bacterium]
MFLFLIVGGITFAACSTYSGCPSTAITKPKISQRDLKNWFAFKEKKSSNYREKEFFAMRTNTYRTNATMKSYFATTSKRRSANTERNFFGTFSYSKNKYRDMDAFASKPKKTRAQREADHFSSPYRKKNMAGSRDYFSLKTTSNKKRASYNKAEESPFASRSKQKQFKQREYQPDLFEPKVLWYKGKKRDKNMPKDSMGKESEKEE